jgi:hypothetical protein
MWRADLFNLRRAGLLDLRSACLLELLDVLQLHGELLPDVQHLLDVRRANNSE